MSIEKPDYLEEYLSEERFRKLDLASQGNILTYALNAGRLDILQKVLAYDLKDGRYWAGSLLNAAYLMDKTDFFTTLVENPAFKALDTRFLPNILNNKVYRPDLLDIMLKAGWLPGDRADENEQRAYCLCAMKVPAEALEHVARYDEKFFDKFARVLFMGSLSRKDDDLTAYLLEYHFDYLDIEAALTNIIEKDLADKYRLIAPYLGKAHKQEIGFFKGLVGVERDDEAEMLARLSAQTSRAGKYLFEIEGLMGLCIDKSAAGVLAEVVTQAPLSAAQATHVLNEFMERIGTGKGFEGVFKACVDKGADLTALSSDALLRGLMFCPALAEQDSFRAAFIPHADVAMTTSIRGHSHETITLLHEKFKDNLKNPQSHLMQALATESPDLVRLFIERAKTGDEHGILADWLADNIGKRCDYALYTDIARTVKPEYITEDFVINLGTYPASPHGWEALKILIRGGFDLSDHTAYAGRLLCGAVQNGLDRDTLDMILDLPELSGKYEALMAGIMMNDEKTVQRLISEHGVDVTQIDWQPLADILQADPQKAERAAATLTHVKMALAEKQAAADKAVESLTRNDRLTPDVLHMILASSTPQKIFDMDGASCTAEDVLKPYKGRRGIDILVGYERYKAFFTAPYWDRDLSALDRLHKALPAYVQKELGADFMFNRRRDRAVASATKPLTGLRRRR